MSAGAYLMVKFSDRSKLLPAVQKLGEADSVAKWDAVDGHYNLVVKLKADDKTFVDTLKETEGFGNLTACELLTDNEQDNKDDSLVYCYAYIETAPDLKDATQKQINSLGNITFCSPVSGGYDLVVMLQDENFDKIERVINEQIRNLDGVLRLKADHIIDLERI